MAIANFEQLCASVCEVAGVAPPALEKDEHGMRAFTFEYEAGQISVMERADVQGLIIVACSLGLVAQADDHRACRLLLASNFMMIGRPSAPSVGRNPATGEFVLHFAQQLEDTSGADLYQAIVGMAELAQEWRDALAGVQPEEVAERAFPLNLA